jgi:hypothetical protein
MKVIFRSNLDDVNREQWPTDLPALPAVGHKVESGTVWQSEDGPRQLELTVLSVTWKNHQRNYGGGNYGGEDHWIPEIYVGVTDMSIEHFTKWYNFIRRKISKQEFVEYLQKRDS